MSIARTSIIAYAVLFVVCSAFGMDLSSVAPSSSMTLVVTQSGRMFALDEIEVQVPAGASTISLDYIAADIDPATVALRVLSPVNAGVKLERYARPDAGGKLLWTVSSPSAQPLVLQMRYMPKGITIATSYRAVLATDGDSMAITASITTGNAGKAAYDSVVFRLSSGQTFQTELPLGRTITRELFSMSDIPILQSDVYDETQYGKNITRVVQMTVPDMAGALPAGSIDFYVREDGIEKRIGAGKLALGMPGANVDVTLRTASDLGVTGGVVSREQLNVKQDVYKKLALYDLRENYEYTFSNTRSEAAEVIFRTHYAGDWDAETAGPAFLRTDATTAEWVVAVPASGEVTLKYSILQKNVTP